MSKAIHLDRFTALDDLTRKAQRDDLTVLRALAKAKRFGAWETQEAYATIDRLESRGLIALRVLGFPWTAVDVTVGGQAAMGAT